MAIHSPLVFLIDVTYSGATPSLYCDITIDGITPISDDATFQCVYLEDVSPTVRRFIFRADSILRGYMEDFEDFVQTAESVAEVLKVKQDFILVFYDEDETAEDTVEMIAFAATRQFGQTPTISEIYDNSDDLYVAGKDKPVYIYFFNDTAGSTAVITDGTTNYPLVTGGETVIEDNDLATWEGSSYETYPENWVIDSNKTFAAAWRIYENPAGEGDLLMTGAVANDYMIFTNSESTWDKGEKVNLTLNYKTTNTQIRIAAVEVSLYAIESGYLILPSDIYALSSALPDVAAYTDIIIPLITLSEYAFVNGPRICILGIFAESAADIELHIDNIKLSAPTAVSYYRLKVNDLESDTIYQLKEGATVLASKTVRVKPFCTDYRYLKYLDRNGQYRFYPFNNRWETKDNPKKIGKINQLITNLLDDQGDSKSVGYTKERKLVLVADDVTEDELDFLCDIYTSPRVYLEVGTGATDEAKDWVLVDVSSRDNLVRRKKGNTSKVELTVTLPEWYNITML